MSDQLSSHQETALSPALQGVPPELQEFYAAWRACRNGALVPKLSDYLDTPAFRLQPFVSIVDLHSPTDIRIRLFGTGLATLAGQDFTTRDIAPYYNADDLAHATKIGWQAAHHPAGYTCIRVVRTGAGLILDSACISLPLAPNEKGLMSMMTLIHVAEDLPRVSDIVNLSAIMGFRFLNWIDLGAGVPAVPHESVLPRRIHPAP